MRVLIRGGFLAVCLALAATAARAQQAERKLEISFANGRVTLTAENVTAADILVEWARRGGTVFTNGQTFVTAPLTLQFTSAPEEEVMASLLRTAAGYVIAQGPGASGKSTLARVYILAKSNPSPSSYVGMAPVSQQNQTPIYGAPELEIPPVNTGRGAPPPASGAQNRPAGGNVSSPMPSYIVPIQIVPSPLAPTSPATGTPKPANGRGGGGGR